MKMLGYRLRRTATVLAAALISTPICAAQQISVKEDTDGVRIETASLHVYLNKDKGYTVDTLTDRRTGRAFACQWEGLVVTEERERSEWANAGFGQPQVQREPQMTARCSVTRSADTVTCATEWENSAVSVKRTLVFRSDLPLFETAYRIRALKPLEEVAYFLQPNDTTLSRNGRFYPGAERYVSRESVEATFKPAPGYVYCHDGKTGIGLLCDTAQTSIRSLAYTTLNPSWKRTHLACYTHPLRWQKPPFDVNFSAVVVVGMEPQAVAALYRTRNPGLPSAEIADVDIQKLIHRTNEPGHARVAIRSNSAHAQAVTVSASIEGGIAARYELPEQTVDVAPGSDQTASIEWQNDHGEYGFELLVRLRDSDGRELDVEREYFAVADHYPKVAQTTVWNAGWMRYDWLVPAMVRKAKRNYVGIIEYYCWAPDQVFDLTPDTETWEPHTESQGSYRTELTRTFLKSLVTAAHGSGLRVLAMDTGFASLPGALQHPERVKYTEDGQIYLYNGKIHDGRRFNAVGAHMFKPEYVRDWAEEMCASVDMFGWDGVRFDWGFIPIAEQDPLHVANLVAGKKGNIYAEARRKAWYTVDGKSAHDLFPKPDETAMQLCALYRETVAKKHPDFTYNANYSVNHGMFDEYPKYSEVNCTDSGILMESLLNVYSTYPTWQDWSGVLTRCLRIVRACRAQPFVGWMRGYAPGGVAHRNIHFIMMASGFRWYGPYGARHSIDGTHERFRHATRFSEYFYDPDFEPQPDDQSLVAVTGDGVERVLWKPFVFARRGSGTRQIMVHLINLPSADHIVMHHELPTAKHSLEVRAMLSATETVTGSWMLVPDPFPRAIELSWTMAGKQAAVVQIPELLSIGTVVLEVKEGK